MIHLADHVRDIEEDPVTAETLYRRGLELTARQFGDHSVRLLHGLHSLGTLLSDRGDPEAETVFRRAISIRRAATGPEHPQVAEGLQLLAGELARQGRLPEAESLQRQALAHSIRTLGARHPVVTGTRLPRLATILALQGRQAEADEMFESALAQTTSSLAVQGEVRRDYGLLLVARRRIEARPLVPGQRADLAPGFLVALAVDSGRHLLLALGFVAVAGHDHTLIGSRSTPSPGLPS